MEHMFFNVVHYGNSQYREVQAKALNSCCYSQGVWIRQLLLQNKELFQDLAPFVWNSFGTIAALIQEIVSIYPVLSPPNLTPAQSNRVCNALALLQRALILDVEVIGGSIVDIGWWQLELPSISKVNIYEVYLVVSNVFRTGPVIEPEKLPVHGSPVGPAVERYRTAIEPVTS
ncbi:CCR4-NOT transcription complex subunit 9 [Vitis vinifera]|uniref:CCR4-NOT transcription complex subunit 9 n=1 Tax=Vitis vinifera TaxID=29760 RepID=A0A438ISB5_VITVI|nr:CCR4-NOT transcription complex subunit 9 [Vitis vinifera]